MTIRLLMITRSLQSTADAQQMVWLATRLPREKFSVHVCAIERSGPLQQPLEAANIPVSVVGWKRLFDVRAIRRLQQTIHDFAPKFVHAWGFDGTMLARWLATRSGPRRILTSAWGIEPGQTETRLFIERNIARRTARFPVSNEFVKDRWVQRGIPAAKTMVVPPGVPLEVPAALGSRASLLEEFNLPPDARLAAFVGPLTTNQRLKDLAWATELIEANHKEFHFLVGGEGPYHWRLERYIRQIERSDRIHLLGERTDWDRILPHFDCYWHAAEPNGTPLELLEAMAAGVPVVASDVAGVNEVIVNNQSGFLVPLGDRAEFARRVTILLEDQSFAHRLGIAGQQRVRELHSVEKWTAHFEDLYTALD